jgi:hypothetical protein
MTLYAVTQSEAELSDRLLQKQGLARLCAWRATAEHEDQVWRWNGHQFRLDEQNGTHLARVVK